MYVRICILVSVHILYVRENTSVKQFYLFNFCFLYVCNVCICNLYVNFLGQE